MSDTVEQLLDQAERDIRSRGYHAVSFRELAAALGIKSASVHYHFPKKEDLGVAVVQRYADKFFEELDRTASDATTPDQHLQAMVELLRQTIVSEDGLCLCGMLGAESAGLPEAVKREVATFFKRNIAWVKEHVTKQNSDNASGIVSTLQGGMMMSIATDDPALFKKACAQLLPA